MADTTVEISAFTSLHSRSVRSGPIWTSPLTGYIFYVDASVPLYYKKTTDGGATWSTEINVTSNVSAISIWYDRWTPGLTGRVIHIAYLNSAADDNVYYRALNTSDDSLGTEVTIFDGASFTAGDWGDQVVDIVRARGGNLYIGFWGDADGEYGFYRSTDAGAVWTSRAQLAEGNPVDGILLMPGDETDEDDIICVYWDRSISLIKKKTYDNSGDSWSSVSLLASMTSSDAYYQMSAAPRHSDGHTIAFIWSNVNDAGADLKVLDLSSTGNSPKTNVLTNTDVSGQVAVLIDQLTDDIYVAYLKGGTWEDSVDVFYKKSTDGGSTWGDEQDYSEASADDIRGLWAGTSVGADGGRFQPMFFNDDLNDLFVNLVNDVAIVPIRPLRAAYVRASVDAVPSQGSARS